MMHIFNMWIIIMQMLNKKEWKILSYRLHKLGSGPTTRPVFTKATQVKILFAIIEKNNCFVSLTFPYFDILAYVTPVADQFLP